MTDFNGMTVGLKAGIDEGDRNRSRIKKDTNRNAILNSISLQQETPTAAATTSTHIPCEGCKLQPEKSHLYGTLVII